MNTLRRNSFLYTIILIEGYVVLSSELLAIRITIPFVGAGTDIISIIIAAVLVPLALGYQAGGNFKPGLQKNGKYNSIRKRLLRNLLVSLCILTIGSSYPLMNDFFQSIWFHIFQTNNRLFLITLYSALFLAPPTFLLGQTLPLISHYFKNKNTAQLSGKLLCYSTIGSFLGATFSTIILMALLGINYAAMLNLILLTSLILVLSKKKITKQTVIAITVALLGVALNSDATFKAMNIIESNQYHTISYVELNDKRMLSMNRNLSSILTLDGRKNEYIEFMEAVALPENNLKTDSKNILVIGAGGFTFGYEDEFNNYEYVDIDPDLQKIAEKYFLNKKLSDNKTFIPQAARAFINKSQKKYDIIIVDTYIGFAPPEHLLTIEFFQSIKERINDEGIVMFHFVLPINLNDKLSRNVDNTARYIFPHIERHVIWEDYNDWNRENAYDSIVYIYKKTSNQTKQEIYTDKKNKIMYDRPVRRP